MIDEIKRKPVTALQVYNAAISTVACVMIGIILNIVWDMKEFKGKAIEKFEAQSISISNLTILTNSAARERETNSNRITILETTAGLLPKEQRKFGERN